jgi:hypothetical protein
MLNSSDFRAAFPGFHAYPRRLSPNQSTTFRIKREAYFAV